MNLATCVESNDDNIMIHNFFRTGNNLLTKMSGPNIFDLKCSRKDIVKNLASMTLIKDIESGVSIDSDLLFQRLLVSASNLVDIQIFKMSSSLNYVPIPLPCLNLLTFLTKQISHHLLKQ